VIERLQSIDTERQICTGEIAKGFARQTTSIASMI